MCCLGKTRLVCYEIFSVGSQKCGIIVVAIFRDREDQFCERWDQKVVVGLTHKNKSSGYDEERDLTLMWEWIRVKSWF